MKKINAWEETTTINGLEYSIIVFCIGNVYECYITNGDEPLYFLFGLPTGKETPESAMQMAIANAPDYAEDFFLTRHSS